MRQPLRHPPVGDDLKIQRKFNEEVLKWLFRKHVDWYDRAGTLKGDLPYIHQRINGVYRHFHDRELENLLRDGAVHANSQETGAFLYLEPLPDKRHIPILSFEYDYTAPSWRIRIGVFCRVGDVAGQKDGWMSEEKFAPQLGGETPNPSAIGFRFESPETGGDDVGGIHDYYHVQPIKSFRQSGHDTNPWDKIPCPRYIPDKQPAMPLGATNFAELMVCVFISLYGVGYVKDVVMRELRRIHGLNGAQFEKQFSGLQELTRCFDAG